MAYGLELRLKALAAYEAGEGSQAEVANIFQISLSTFKRWIWKNKKGEDLKPPESRSGRPRKINESGIETLKRLVETNPSITLIDLSEAYYKKHKVRVSLPVLCRELTYLNLRYKKLSIRAVEKETDDIKKKKNSTY